MYPRMENTADSDPSHLHPFLPPPPLPPSAGHLEGSVHFPTLLELARANGTLKERDGSDEEWKGRYLLQSPCGTLTEVLERMWTTQALLGSEEVLERVAYETIKEAALEGTRLLELRYSPSFIRIGHDMSYETIHRGVTRGVQRGCQDYDIGVGLIGIIDRNLSFEEASISTEFIIQNKNTFVGIDVAGDECNFSSKPFAPLFHMAKRNGLHVTIHAGEVPLSVHNVRDAIELLGAERIGHGIQILEDPELVKLAKERDIVLEVCPISNWLVGSVKEYRDHPVGKLVESGLKVTISSDDPGLFGITLNDEYDKITNEKLLTSEQLRVCNEIAAKHSFIDGSTKSHFWK